MSLRLRNTFVARIFPCSAYPGDVGFAFNIIELELFDDLLLYIVVLNQFCICFAYQRIEQLLLRFQMVRLHGCQLRHDDLDISLFLVF